MPNGFAHCPPALTADAMRAADRYTIDEYGLSSRTLMEVAGRGCAERLQDAYGPLNGHAVMVLCGKGNNGGDGLVVARHLATDGVRVHVVLAHPPDALRADAAHNLSLLRTLQEAVGEALTIEPLQQPEALSATADALHPRLYVDALLGTGLTSDVREPVHGLVEWTNHRSAPTVALDVPTGLHSDTGAVLGTAVRADRTVTLAAPKVGLQVGEGPPHAGPVEVVDIGIPPFVLDRAAAESGCARQTTDAAVRAWWPPRRHDAYKYSAGTVLVVGGAPQYTGAPALAARAAARGGAGYVQCACPETVQPTLAGRLSTVPTRALPADEAGLVPDAALEALDEALEGADALVVGPGLGRAPGTEAFVRRLVVETAVPLVLDADGLNALADDMDAWAARREAPWVLTPHAGEFRRLAGEAVDLTDRVRTAQAYARRWGATCVLKGAPSIVAGAEGTTLLGRTHTPALATAGSGDVLAGQCAGLLAQGLAPVPAAATALHVGGAAAERYAATRDLRSMTATDLVEAIPRVAAERFGAQ
jgi:NAD(P)H-hydrate epimerase